MWDKRELRKHDWPLVQVVLGLRVGASLPPCYSLPERWQTWLFLRSYSRHARYVERHVRHLPADPGENTPADSGVHFSCGDVAAIGQTGIGATESLRPGGVADAFEYGAERHHW